MRKFAVVGDGLLLFAVVYPEFRKGVAAKGRKKGAKKVGAEVGGCLLSLAVVCGC